jgi:DNA-binding LacI/PurR family transcriptional regulator
MESARRPTSADVARMAGVSRATVSAVLNGRHGNIRVSDATRQRVLAMATTLAYVPHATAQALRRQQSGVLGFIPRAGRGSPIASPGPYHLSLAIARAAQEQGYHVLEASTEAPAGDIARTAGDFLIARHVDGIIVQTPDTAAEVEHLVQFGVPVIQVLHPQAVAGAASVTVTVAPGITAVIEHLLALGHRRLAFLGQRGLRSDERLAACQTVLAEHGHTIPPAAIALAERFTMEAGRRLTLALLERGTRPTALFAASDTLAAGALHALHEVRFRVPDDLSLVSYDDLLAPVLCPPLTSVRTPLTLVAEQAVTLLVARLRGSADAAVWPAQLTLPTGFTVRASTGPPPTLPEERSLG